MSIFKRTQRKYVKKAYRVRNWREYEAGLRNRGSLTVWISLTAGKLSPGLDSGFRSGAWHPLAGLCFPCAYGELESPTSPPTPRSGARHGLMTIEMSPARRSWPMRWDCRSVRQAMQPAIVNWDAPRPRRRKPGRQRKYSNHAIETAVTLGMVFHLSSRQSEGLLRSLFALMKLDNDVPDHTTISRRKAKLGKVLCLLFIHPGAPNLISLRSAGTMPA